MAKQKSRTARWSEAVSDARSAYESIDGLSSDLRDALGELRDVQSEYQDWLDNLPENLQNSALGEKLQTVVDIDIESIADEPLENWGQITEALDEAEGAELPQ